MRYWMALIILAAVISISVCCSMFPGKGESGFLPLEKEWEAAGLDIWYPATKNVEPGYLFQVLETSEGTKFRRSLCSQAYSSMGFIEDEIRLASFTAKSHSQAEMTLGLSEEVLRDRARVDGFLNNENIKSVTIEFGPIKTAELPTKAQADGSVRSIKKTCEINIREKTNENGQFETPTFLLVKTASSNKIQYIFTPERSFDAGFEAVLHKLFDLDVSISTSGDGKKVLTLDESTSPQFVLAGNVVEVESIRFLDQVAGAGGRPARMLINSQKKNTLSEALRIPEED